MVSFFFLSIIVFAGVNWAFTTNDVKMNRHHLNRLSRSNDQQRTIRNIMDGQKQQGLSSVVPMSNEPSSRYLEDLACLEACYKCVEDYPVTMRKKKAADNCGPMCDCANSCTHKPIETIDKIYGQGAATRGDKGCFWRTYTQVLNNEIPSLQ
ncbi:hypothetical protein I4U23_025740 [Adineta vaga]|nr:hypothetical protein I4U23_025740 [Adineta vaga]